MSVNFGANFNLSTLSAFSSLSQTSFSASSSISTSALSSITDGFLAGGGLNFAQVFSSLPAAPMPRPPMFSATLGQAAMALGGFLGSVGQFGGNAGSFGMGFAKGGLSTGIDGGMQQSFGYGSFMKMNAMSRTIENFMSTQALYGQSSVSHMHLGIDVNIRTEAQMQRKLKDEFATGLAAGKQGLSNLANSPEVTLAINQIMKEGGGKLIKMEALQTKLKEQYGIESELGKEKGVKTLKFKNGDKIADANGNGGLDMGDYKLGKATDAIMKKYGLDKKEVGKFLSTDEGKKALGARANQNGSMYTAQNLNLHMDMNFMQSQNNQFGFQQSAGFMNMDVFNSFFAQALSFAM